MSYLKKAIDSLSEKETRIFHGVYAHQNLNLYDDETDELGTGIGALIGDTEHVFHLHVQPADSKLYGLLSYHVTVSYFKQMRADAIVPGHLLLDFLMNATLVIQENPLDLIFEYNSPDK